MGTTIGIIGLFVAIALLVVLAFKGHSVIIAAPIAALIAVLFSYGLKGHFREIGRASCRERVSSPV